MRTISIEIMKIRDERKTQGETKKTKRDRKEHSRAEAIVKG